ncbi:MAG: patatin-like phospholipase family protein [Actinobacteria bacterium]|nr:patatin-like phospholipase family protein [Actinomycetota bacterium]
MNPASPERFNILSLDGGGLKGLFSAAVLAEFERDLNISLVDHFDLICGTSTGGLIALGLGAGMSPDEIVEFYVTHGPRIFPRRSWIRQVFSSKHKPEQLRAALEETFGDRVLRDSKKRLLIPSYTLDGDEVYVFKTPHHKRLTRDGSELMVDVGMATSAAPTFLPVFKLRNNRLIDGGVWATNPTFAGIAEAISMLGIPLSAIHVLSLGSTDAVSANKTSLDRGGFFQWRRAGAKVLLRAQSLGTLHAAEHLITPQRIERIDPKVSDGLFNLDRIDVGAIRGIAEDVSRRCSPKIIPFTAHRADDPWQASVRDHSSVTPPDQDQTSPTRGGPA